MLKYVLTLLIAIIPAISQGEIWSGNHVLEATCRIDAGNSFGTGSCISYKNGMYNILTNAHVVGNADSVKVEFWKGGRKTAPLPAKVVYRKLIPNSTVDFAIVSVSEKYFGNHPPRIAKLAPRDAKTVGGYIVSAGCPGARWPSAFEGFIIKESYDQILFYPPPLGGQSGSGVYVVCKTDNGYETYLKGVITYRIDGGIPGKTVAMGYEANHGGAITINKLLDAMEGKVSTEIQLPDTYTPVIFDKLKYKNRNYYTPKPAVQQANKTTVPYKKETPVYQQDETAGRIFRPKPDVDNPDVDNGPMPLPSPDTDNPTPGPDVTPRPDSGPYDLLPEFIADEMTPTPSIADELNKADAEKKAAEEKAAQLEAETKAKEEALKAAEIEKARVEAEKAAADKKAAEEAAKLEAEKKAVSEEKDWWMILSGALGSGGILSILGVWAKNKGWLAFLGLYKKVKPLDKLEEKADSFEDQVQARLAKYLGEEAAASLRAQVEQKEEEAKRLVEQEVLRRLAAIKGLPNAAPVVQQVNHIPVSLVDGQGLPVVAVVNNGVALTKREALAESLSPIAKEILNDASLEAAVAFINRVFQSSFKDRPEGEI